MHNIHIIIIFVNGYLELTKSLFVIFVSLPVHVLFTIWIIFMYPYHWYSNAKILYPSTNCGRNGNVFWMITNNLCEEEWLLLLEWANAFIIMLIMSLFSKLYIYIHITNRKKVNQSVRNFLKYLIIWIC